MSSFILGHLPSHFISYKSLLAFKNFYFPSRYMSLKGSNYDMNLGLIVVREMGGN